MQFNPNFDPAQNPERIPFKFCPDYGALPFSSTHSPAMREPKLNMSTVPVQNNYNYFQTHTPSIANHRISGTSKASVPRSSDTSIMSSMPTNGMECTTTTVKIPVKLLSRWTFILVLVGWIFCCFKLMIKRGHNLARWLRFHNNIFDINANQSEKLIIYFSCI